MSISLSAQPHDLISELLMGMRFNGVVYRQLQLTAPFGIHVEKAHGRAKFYFISQGMVYLHYHETDELFALQPGDALLIPHSKSHALLSSKNMSTLPIADLSNSHDIDRMDEQALCTHACKPDETIIFCGHMDFDLGNMQPLVTAMPKVMMANTLLDRYPELPSILQAMQRESVEKRAGYAGILAKLTDTVSAIIVRGWVECGCHTETGWIKALNDPQLGKAIVVMHASPDKNWTVAELASTVGQSRSVFAKRFMEAMHMSPIQYLTELRMRLAAQWITQDKENVESAAYKLGYSSLAAFSRAFKRTIGHPPTCLKSKNKISELAPILQPEEWPCSKTLMQNKLVIHDESIISERL